MRTSRTEFKQVGIVEETLTEMLALTWMSAYQSFMNGLYGLDKA